MNENPMTARVSLLARLVPALSFMLVAAGAALSALLVRNGFWAMKEAESAGVAVVAGAIAHANLCVLIALYLATVCGLAGILVCVIRLVVETKTFAPSPWLFMSGCALGLLPALLLWAAESTLIGVLAGRSNVIDAASTISWLLILNMIAAPFSILSILAGSLWPLSSRAKRRWGPLVALVTIEVVLIVIAIAFQVRTSWLYQVASLGRM